jgi:hypothetical protein
MVHTVDPIVTTNKIDINTSVINSASTSISSISSLSDDINKTYMIYDPFDINVENSLTISNLKNYILGSTNKTEIGANENCIYLGYYKILPNVIQIKIINNKEMQPIGVIVEFEDGTQQKAICSEDDVFNYEMGVLICLVKRMLTLFNHLDNDRGTYYYNKLMDIVFKQHDETMRKKQTEEETKKIIARKRAKRAKKLLKKQEKKREQEIEIQKEAIVRAMKEINASE